MQRCILYFIDNKSGLRSGIFSSSQELASMLSEYRIHFHSSQEGGKKTILKDRELLNSVLGELPT